MVDQRESQAGTWSETCTTLNPATLSGLPLIFGSDLRCRPTAADRCDAATRASGHRFVVMPQVLWQTMMKEFPAAHVVTGMLPSEDAAAGLGRVGGSLLGRLASALPVSGCTPSQKSSSGTELTSNVPWLQPAMRPNSLRPWAQRFAIPVGRAAVAFYSMMKLPKR